jgi:hypothetical protein
MHDVAHPIDRFCIPSHDDVTHEQPNARGRPIRIYAHDENAAPPFRRLRVIGLAAAPHRLQAGTKISPKNMTLREELIDDTIDCRRGNSQHAATWPQDGHADEASLRVDEGAAFSARAKHKIHADEVIDSATAKTVPRPSHRGDDAEAGDRHTLVISDCQDDMTRSQRRRIGGRRRRQSIRLEAQDSDVRAGIPTRERSVDSAPIGKRNLDVLVSLQSLFSGDDDSGTPMDAARGPSTTAVNCDNAAAGAIDQMCGMIRKRDKWIGGFGH